MVFQGTVLGTTLWNIFFADVQGTGKEHGCKEQCFADDLSTCKSYRRDVANEEILKDMHDCQASVHEWGVTNRVSFDPAKEEFAVLSPQDGHGNTFRLLGPLIDPKLLMHECLDKVYRKAKAKSRSLLRCRKFFDLYDLLLLFKAHVRSQVEWVYGAVFHSAPSGFARLDSIQTSFLHHIGVQEDVAFLRYNLAPWQIRRDIGMLGVLWKISRGTAHRDMCALFPMCAVSGNLRTRSDHRRHPR